LPLKENTAGSWLGAIQLPDFPLMDESIWRNSMKTQQAAIVFRSGPEIKIEEG